MKARGARTRIAPNIYEDAIGRSAVARVGKLAKEKRFKAGTPERTINAWLEDERAKMRRQKARVIALRGTLAGDIGLYLAGLPDGRSKDNTRWDLGAWSASYLGQKRRNKITVSDLRSVVRDWLEADVAASTINHRRRALAQLYEALDGRGAENPVREVKRAKEVLGEPVAYPMDALTALIDGMDPTRGRNEKGRSSFNRVNLSQARLRLLLWTGMPPAGVRLLNPRRVAKDLERGELWYPPRGKGAGAAAVLLPLFPQGRRAVELWLKAGAWGPFSEGSIRKALQRAAAAYAKQEAEAGRMSPVSPDITVYHLRHSHLTWLYETTGDPYLVQLYGQHADLETTKRYTRKGVPHRAREAVARIKAVG